MDDFRFDRLTKALANGISRRQTLKLFVATVVGSFLEQFGVGVGLAQSCVPVGGTCSKDADCCAVCVIPGVHLATCSNGVCTCSSQTCSGYCTDTSLDPTNCGSCGHACPPNNACCGGTCIPGGCGGGGCLPCTSDTDCTSLGSGYLCCSGCCTNVQDSDNTNCGGCGIVCPGCQGCCNGVCKDTCSGCTSDSQCASGQKCCSGTCANVQTLTASRSGVTISGTNPPHADIRARLANDTLAQIACGESVMQQFVNSIDGIANYCPNWSDDNLGGVGIMQLTRPAPTVDQVWNWQANVDGGITVYNAKLSQAQAYPGQYFKLPMGMRQMAAYNANRTKHGLKPLKSISLPPFDPTQLQRETIRSYNSGHEYTAAVDAKGLLIVTVAPNGTTGTAQWVQIPISGHPHCGKNCCPNYVAFVLTQSPTCPAVKKVPCCYDPSCP